MTNYSAAQGLGLGLGDQSEEFFDKNCGMAHHTHCAHWLPVHIHDLENLPHSIVKEFQDHGHWVVTKTTNHLSAMPINQAHEQNNMMVNSCSGVVGLTENPAAFRKWRIAGPEQA